MVPKGWRVTRVGDTGVVHAGRQRSPHFKDGELRPYLRVANVFDGYIDMSDVNQMPFTEDEFERYRLVDGDILLNEGQSLELVGRAAMYKGAPADCCFQNTLVRYQAGPKMDASYALSLFQFCQHSGLFTRIATKTNSIAHLGVSRFADLNLPFPPLAEQQKIAEILSTWDRAIEVAEAQLANARKQKRALMQSLLTGKRRFPEFQDQPWKEVRFESVFERVKRKNSVGNENTLTISGQDGLVSQQEYFNKRVAAADLSGYTLLVGGDFAYNKSYSAGYPMGAIKMLADGQTGVVSSLYLCFALGDRSAHSREFFRHYFEFGCFNREIYKIAQEGARNHGLLNVSVHDFFRTKLFIPQVEEQKKIAEAINLAEDEEGRAFDALKKLRTEKKALMQQLLTGKRRVSI